MRGKSLAKIIFSAFAVMLMCFTVKADVQAGDSVSTATLLSNGVFVEDSLAKNNSSNWYKFEMDKKGYFTLTLQPQKLEGINDGWKVILYDGNLEKVYTYPEVTSSLYTIATPYAKGTYYVEVVSDYQYSAPTGVMYSFKVDCVEDASWETEQNGSGASANEIVPEKIYQGYLGESTDVDFYKVTTTKNGYFTVTLSLAEGEAPIGNTDGWYFTVYNKNLEKIISYAEIKNTCTTVALPYPPDTYYIEVEADYQYDAPTYVKYNLLVKETESKAWESEGNNESKNATAIEMGKTYFGILNGSDDDDYYKFTTTHAGSFSVDLGPAPNADTTSVGDGWYIEIYDKNMDKVAKVAEIKNTTTSEAIVYAAGTYYIKVEPDYYYDAPAYLEYNITVSEPAKEGAYATYDGCYFYRNDEGDTVCYYTNGKQVINEFKCDGTYTYYFQADGTAMRSRLTYHPDGVHVIYFDEYGHEVFSDFANVKKTIEGNAVDDYCFFDVNGYLYVDVVTYDKEGKNLYYANPFGVMDRGKWFEFSDSCKWADGTPFDKAGGRYGYANDNGTLMVNKWTTDWEGRKCYMQGNGVAKYE